MSKRYPGLVPRGGVWIIRKRVPKALQAILGKQEIWKRFHTSDRRQAKIDYLTVKAGIEGELERARESLVMGKPRLLTSAMAEVFVARWFRTNWELALDQTLNAYCPSPYNWAG